MRKITLLSGLYIFVIFLLFLYSYTQVDLSLTLSRVSVFQSIEKFFQYIGYFQRSLSTVLYISLLILLYGLYVLFLLLAHKDKISKKQFWTILLISSIILTFS